MKKTWKVTIGWPGYLRTWEGVEDVSYSEHAVLEFKTKEGKRIESSAPWTIEEQ